MTTIFNSGKKLKQSTTAVSASTITDALNTTVMTTWLLRKFKILIIIIKSYFPMCWQCQNVIIK
jgi:hypothetical protein